MENRFLRGNCNGDDVVDISDSIYSLGYLFAGGETPGCLEACNVNGKEYDISDPIYVLGYLFSGGLPHF